ncbi:MAG: Nucleotidyltransferase/DNA polymerase involved in DNA repair/SOS mutagenesis and repair [Parcubacteria group bacterium GW2011_GWA2_43_11]|nr:MAG: Nucleotidyltransferase/DNA polymerase involved in DNA repair/SOS mutagenesis and repair [Parcubacteria group bacterium GW2011_GWA2_43_11]
MTEYIFLIDCDNFFVSCERLFRPDLAHHPVAVLSSNDGCIVSRSLEVKKLGIKMGEPYFKIKVLCEQHKVALFSSNFELYRDISNRVMSVLRRFSDVVEVYSIDEAFLALSVSEDIEAFLLRKANDIRATVLQEVGVPVSVGIAKTKTLAKVAAHFAKPQYMGNGSNVLIKNSNIQKALQDIAVGDVWGIGRAYAQKLARKGIVSALDLCNKDDAWIRKETNVVGLRTVSELRGVCCFHLGEDEVLRKSLLSSQSFSRRVTSLRNLETAVAGHARTIAGILRSESAVAKEVSVFIYSPEGNGKKSKSVDVEILLTYTNDTFLIVATALDILKRIYRPNVAYKKAGVLVRNIVPDGAQPRETLFGEPTNTNSVLMHVLDDIRQTHGDIVQLGVEMQSDTWRARREYLSPRRTTRWGEALSVNIQ